MIRRISTKEARCPHAPGLLFGTGRTPLQAFSRRTPAGWSVAALVLLLLAGCSPGGDDATKQPEEAATADTLNTADATHGAEGEPTGSADAAARPDSSFATYANERFGYVVAYPRDLLTPQGEPQNADGQRFLSADSSVVLTVFGRHNVQSASLGTLYDEARRETGRSVAYRQRSDDWFVVSGTDGDRVFYRKTILKDGVVCTMDITYDRSQRDALDAVVTRIAESFRPSS